MGLSLSSGSLSWLTKTSQNAFPAGLAHLVLGLNVVANAVNSFGWGIERGIWGHELCQLFNGTVLLSASLSFVQDPGIVWSSRTRAVQTIQTVRYSRPPVWDGVWAVLHPGEEIWL